MVNRVLMIAFHYPPVIGSSGLQRTLKFSRYLLEHNWEPTILTVHPRAHSQTGTDQLKEIPEHIQVVRTWALDASRHLAVWGIYPAVLARPDRWISWWLSAVPAGLKIIKRQRPQLIWSTYPIATAHVIAATLQRLSGLPWVADFRDIMIEGDYPEDLQVRRHFQRIEANTVARASRVVFTTSGALKLYAKRYPQESATKWRCIRNGFDESNFAEASQLVNRSSKDRIHLLHSGLLYPSERDPSCFFAALADLKQHGVISATKLRIILRATGHDNHHLALIERYDIGDIVRLEPAIGHNEALSEMLDSDGLLIFQAANCNNQVPAKLYEYIRAGRPILALTDPAGDTAQILREAGIGEIVRLTDTKDIKAGLQRFIQAIDSQQHVPAQPQLVQKFSRFSQTAELARLLNEVVSQPS